MGRKAQCLSPLGPVPSEASACLWPKGAHPLRGGGMPLDLVQPAPWLALRADLRVPMLGASVSNGAAHPAPPCPQAITSASSRRPE